MYTRVLVQFHIISFMLTSSFDVFQDFFRLFIHYNFDILGMLQIIITFLPFLFIFKTNLKIISESLRLGFTINLCFLFESEFVDIFVVIRLFWCLYPPAYLRILSSYSVTFLGFRNIKPT